MVSEDSSLPKRAPKTSWKKPLGAWEKAPDRQNDHQPYKYIYVSNTWRLKLGVFGGHMLSISKFPRCIAQHRQPKNAQNYIHKNRITWHPEPVASACEWVNSSKRRVCEQCLGFGLSFAGEAWIRWAYTFYFWALVCGQSAKQLHQENT